MSWAKQEFETIELGDARLNQRAVLLAERLGQKPGASIPGACENWAETAAAYRFLRNEQVGWEEVLSAHAQASQARIREHAVVLCIQDTTELDYNGQAMSGLGPLSFEAQRGLYLHPTYVVSPEREPLGVTNAWTWAREFKKGDAPRGKLPTGEVDGKLSPWSNITPCSRPERRIAVFRLIAHRNAAAVVRHPAHRAAHGIDRRRVGAGRTRPFDRGDDEVVADKKRRIIDIRFGPERSLRLRGRRAIGTARAVDENLEFNLLAGRLLERE